MNSRLTSILRRQAYLSRQCAQQREALTHYQRELAPVLSFADRAWSVAQRLRAHPTLLLAPLSLFAFKKPRRLLRLAVRALTLWRVARTLRSR